MGGGWGKFGKRQTRGLVSSKEVNTNATTKIRSTTVTVTWHASDYKFRVHKLHQIIVQELCESRGGRPGLSVLTSLLVSVDVKIYCTVLRHWSQLVPNMSHDI